MKKCIFIFISFILFIIIGSGCVPDPIPHINKTVNLTDKEKLFIKILEYTKNQGTCKEIKKKRKKELKDNEKFPFEDENYTWEIRTEDLSNPFITLKDPVSPKISINGEYIGVFERNIKALNSKITYSYGIVVQSSSNMWEKEIFYTGEYNFDSNEHISTKFSNVSWNPCLNILAFLCRNKKNNYNLFLASIDKNKEELKLEYTVFQITKNTDEDVIYFDLNWSKNGDLISFNEKKRNGNYKTYIFDLTSMKFSMLSLNENTLCFRFGNDNNNNGFVIIEKDNFYIPYYLEDYRKFSQKKKIPDFNAVNEPFIFSSFADNKNMLAFYTLQDESDDFLYVYNNKLNKTIKNVLISPHVKKFEYIPISNPLWLYNDNMIILHSYETVMFFMVNDPVWEKMELVRHDFISGEGNWNLNSLSMSIDKEMLFSVMGAETHQIGYKKIKLRTVPTRIVINEFFECTIVNSEQYLEYGKSILLKKGRRVYKKPERLYPVLPILGEVKKYALNVKYLNQLRNKEKIIVNWPKGFNLKRGKQFEVELKPGELIYIPDPTKNKGD